MEEDTIEYKIEKINKKIKIFKIIRNIEIILVLISIFNCIYQLRILNNYSRSGGHGYLIEDSCIVNSFNSTFKIYEGKQKGADVKSLIKLIEKSNKGDIEHPITIIAGDGINDNEIHRYTIKASITYYVDFEYDEDGFITTAKISIYNKN